MLKHALIFLGVLMVALGDRQDRRHKHVDPFAALDRHISHALSYHYLWPWSELMKAAATLDIEESLEEPQIKSDANKFEVRLSVRRFKPDELRVKVKNRYILVEGKHQLNNDEKQFMANHFVQRFVLPAGSKQEEVTAVLNEKGVLTISAPKHVLPPPPPEREVPIEVILPVTEKAEVETEKEKVEVTSTTEKKEVTEAISTTTIAPLDKLELAEATTHIGKIRKKELKGPVKSTKDNEVTKGGEGNGLDYALIENE